MRNSFVFYRSFNEAMEELSENDQLVLYRAIVGYGLDSREPSFNSSYLRMAWKLIKPQLDANWKRYNNGCKGKEFGKRGGAPKGNKNATKTTPKQPQDNPKTTPNDNDNDNDNNNKESTKVPKKDELSLPHPPQSEKFVKFNEWLQSNCPHLLKMQQITEKELDTLLTNYQSEDIFNTLRSMENYKDTAKKNRSVYRTLRNWLNRDNRKKGGVK